MDSAVKLLAEAERAEAALSAAKKELEQAEKDLRSGMEKWQTQCALNGESAKPKGVEKLEKRVPELHARVSGLKTHPQPLYHEARALRTELDSARGEFNKQQAAAWHDRLEAAERQVRNVIAAGLALEEAIGVNFLEQKERVRAGAPAQVDSAIAEPLRLSKELERRVSRARAWRKEQWDKERAADPSGVLAETVRAVIGERQPDEDRASPLRR
ncbi:MAG: hypothetical protein HYX72_10470 [Acidobacteria bacterium]|nr:hypothetical protein [Acidobacteriota bacterium]